ncbi:uncharacterized protein DUF2442 [Spirosoma oryzae]|uniref:Uncharacterized protein DUF2442 n=1 Tax=Spirosoma oryzae TaxID=1469603 RepID=A0A2T0T398_9BACT|nr:uncharacterized protein DUF2442 [Spirosoma oryzae]
MMNPRVLSVQPTTDFQLLIHFTNQERKVFDVKPYLSVGVFRALQDITLFNQVKPFNGTVVWPNNLDIDPDTLYLDGEPAN